MVRDFLRWELTVSLCSLLWFSGANLRAEEPTPDDAPPAAAQQDADAAPTPLEDGEGQPTPLKDDETTPPAAGNDTTEPTTESTPEPTAEGTDLTTPPTTDEGRELKPLNSNDLEEPAPNRGVATNRVEKNEIDTSAADAEIVRERHANTAIKIERHVVQDADGNYINHGVWKWWDDKGNLIAHGQYNRGQRNGTWSRWFQRPELKQFQQGPYTQFAAPFLSQATFFNGKLDGNWTVFDAQHRKVCEISFEDGERHGPAIWYSVKGQKLREVEYDGGEFHGRYTEWNTDGKLLTNDIYENGRKQAMKLVNRQDTNVKQSEVTFLFPKLTLKDRDDFWNGTFATYSPQGTEIKHGPWTGWHENGQVRVRGEFANNAPVGRYTWYFTNGQKQIEGEYKAGKQHGAWIWFHANGQKQIFGEYVDGVPTGKWAWWKDDGKLAQKIDMTDGKAKIEQATVPSPELIRPIR